MSHCLLCGNDILRWCIIFLKKDIFSPSLRRSLNFGHQMVCKVICAEAESDENCNWWSPYQNSCNKIISKGNTQNCSVYSCTILGWSLRTVRRMKWMRTAIDGPSSPSPLPQSRIAATKIISKMRLLVLVPLRCTGHRYWHALIGFSGFSLISFSSLYPHSS